MKIEIRTKEDGRTYPFVMCDVCDTRVKDTLDTIYTWNDGDEWAKFGHSHCLPDLENSRPCHEFMAEVLHVLNIADPNVPDAHFEACLIETSTLRNDPLAARKPWVVEWSESQQCFHFDPLSKSIEQNREADFNGVPTDYKILAIADRQELQKISEQLEKGREKVSKAAAGQA